jgi:hypothetical protein
MPLYLICRRTHMQPSALWLYTCINDFLYFVSLIMDRSERNILSIIKYKITEYVALLPNKCVIGILIQMLLIYENYLRCYITSQILFLISE